MPRLSGQLYSASWLRSLFCTINSIRLSPSSTLPTPLRTLSHLHRMESMQVTRCFFHTRRISSGIVGWPLSSGIVGKKNQSRYCSLLPVRQLWLTRSRETRTGQFEINVLSQLLETPIAVWNQMPAGGETVLLCLETHGAQFDGEALHVVYDGNNHYEVLLQPGLQRPVYQMDAGNQCISE